VGWLFLLVPVGAIVSPLVSLASWTAAVVSELMIARTSGSRWRVTEDMYIQRRLMEDRIICRVRDLRLSTTMIWFVVVGFVLCLDACCFPEEQRLTL